MCGLCGVLGSGAHWTDDRTGDGAGGSPQTRRAARLARVRLMNAVLAHYGLSLADWQGSSYVLTGATGRSELVGDIVQVWRAAERMSGRACDPLDPCLLARLERDG
jgi:hypothetical protein